MPTKITYDQLADRQGLEALEQQLKQIGIEIKTIKDTLKNIKSADSKGLKALNTQAQKLAQSENNLIRVQNLYTKQQQRAYNQAAKLEAKERDLVNASRMQVKSLDDLKNKTNALVKIRSRLDTTTKQGRQDFARLTKEINNNSNALKRADASIGRYNRNVGNYRSALNGIAGAFGVSLGLYGAVRTFGKALSTIKDFSAELSRLKAITGATVPELQKLEENAKLLGRTTPRTASEVAALQVEFAKLGFSTKEILNATSATLNLSIATKSDLAEAANIAGSTVRGFGLDAKETGRVVDVMAKSFSTTALDIDNFSEAIKYVAPIAKSTGFTIEETTAMLGKLADAGIRGSMAGTSLRRILLEVAKSGKPPRQAFDELARAGISVADANDEVGQRAQTALLILSDQKDEVNKLTDAYNNAAGAGAEMAKVMQDNLTGDVLALKSAWEGLILSFQEGQNVFRDNAQFLTALINSITDARTKTKGELSELDKYRQADKATREAIMQGWQQQYDTYFENWKKAKEAGDEQSRQFYALQIDYTIEYINKLKAIDAELIKQAENTKKTTEASKEGNKTKEVEIGLIGGLNSKLRELNKLRESANTVNEVKVIDNRIKQIKKELQWIDDLSNAWQELTFRQNENTQGLADMSGIVKRNENIVASQTSKFKQFIDTNGGYLKSAGKESINYFKNVLSEIVDNEIEQQQRLLQIRDQNINQLQDQLNTELQAQKDKDANSVQLLQERVDKEKKLRAETVDNMRKLEKEKLAIDTATQASSLITSSANIFKSLSPLGPIGVAIAGGVIAAMFAAFIKSKSQAFQLASSENYAEGVVDYKGKGNETSDSNPVNISNHESVIKASATKKSKRLLTEINEERLTDAAWFQNKALIRLNSTSTSNNNDLINEIRQHKEVSENTLKYMKFEEPHIFIRDGKVHVMKGNVLTIYTQSETRRYK